LATTPTVWQVRVWDVADRKEIASQQSPGSVSGLYFTPDGKEVIGVSVVSTASPELPVAGVILWELTSGGARATFNEPTSAAADEPHLRKRHGRGLTRGGGRCNSLNLDRRIRVRMGEGLTNTSSPDLGSATGLANEEHYLRQGRCDLPPGEGGQAHL